ncbi:MAG: hypothetical protein HS122_00615 [Opitutaceae bacterium]|nr:hypothetical protein [Opitutaceae bacterium]
MFSTPSKLPYRQITPITRPSDSARTLDLLLKRAVGEAVPPTNSGDVGVDRALNTPTSRAFTDKFDSQQSHYPARLTLLMPPTLAQLPSPSRRSAASFNDRRKRNLEQHGHPITPQLMPLGAAVYALLFCLLTSFYAGRIADKGGSPY